MVYDKLQSRAYYYVYDNFKSKTASIIVKSILGSRLSRVMTFEGYGAVSFKMDDCLKANPHVMMQEAFSRVSTSTLVFNIDNEYCPYNKVFIFNHILPVKDKLITGSYSLIFYNTETETSMNVRAISLEPEYLLKEIQYVALRTEPATSVHENL